MKNRRVIKYLLVFFVSIVLLGTIIFFIIQPVTLISLFNKKLTAQVMSINDNHTQNFHYPYGYRSRQQINLTIVVEVTYDYQRSVKGARVEINGPGGGDFNETNRHGITTLHLPYIPSSSFHVKGYDYLTLSAWKDDYYIMDPKAIKIFWW